MLRCADAARAAQLQRLGRRRGLGELGLGELGGAAAPGSASGGGVRSSAPFLQARSPETAGPDSYLLFTGFLKSGAPSSMFFVGVKSVGASQFESLRGRSSQLTEERVPGPVAAPVSGRLPPLSPHACAHRHTVVPSKCTPPSLTAKGRARTHAGTVLQPQHARRHAVLQPNGAHI